MLNIIHTHTPKYKTQKRTHYQIKHLFEYLNKMLVLKNAAVKRLQIRINETPIQELKQRMRQYLENTHNQKNGLEKIISKLSEQSNNYVISSQTALDTHNIIKNNDHTLKCHEKPSKTFNNHFSRE